MFHHHQELCQDLDFKIDNSGDKLTVTITGDKKKLTLVEKKLNAMHTLCCEGGGCC